MSGDQRSAKARAALVDSLGSALRSGEHGLSTVPALLKRVLAEESWREFTTQRDEHVVHERFVDFVTTPPLAGIGSSVDLLRRIVADDVEALDLLDQALAGRQGERTDLHNNVKDVAAPVGNSKERALRKLRKDAPELHAEVLAGNLSAHAAMVKAGYRPRTFTVRADSPESAARAIREKMAPDDLARLISILSEST